MWALKKAAENDSNLISLPLRASQIYDFDEVWSMLKEAIGTFESPLVF